jgi:hypothetical protein
MAVEVHLRRCAPCQAAYRQISSIKECLGRTRQQVAAPADFTTSLQSRLRQLESRAFLVSERTTTKVRRTIMLTAVGVAVLMAAGLFALLAFVQQSAGPAAPAVAQWRMGRAWNDKGSRALAASLVFMRDATLRSGSPPAPVAAATEQGPDQKPVTSVSY